ncbi:hypothetical protein V8D89_002190 [Ganoderma adspersum]
MLLLPSYFLLLSSLPTLSCYGESLSLLLANNVRPFHRAPHCRADLMWLRAMVQAAWPRLPGQLVSFPTAACAVPPGPLSLLLGRYLEGDHIKMKLTLTHIP